MKAAAGFLSIVLAMGAGYAFQLDVDGSQSFKATATPTDSNKQGWPTLSIDASMQVAER